MAQDWYFTRQGQQQGPVSRESLEQLALTGQLQPTDHVWCEGMSGWQTAGTVPGLFAPGQGPADTPPAGPTTPTTVSAPMATAGAAAPAGGKRCHEVDYDIMGDDMQLVEVELDPGETVIAEAGAMNYMEDGIGYEARFGDGSKPDQGFWSKVGSGAKRMFTGESLFMTHFTNQGAGKKRVSFAGPYPGKIVPLDLSEIGGAITCQKDAFLCAAMGTEVTIAFSKKLGAGFFGGEGFILQRLIGDGMAFIHAGGTIVERKLAGEKLSVDTGCLVAFTDGIDYSIERAGSLKTMVFGGEGLFLARLQGTGTVWLQSLPFSRLADRIIGSARSMGGSSKGEGSILGGLGNLFGD